MRAWAAAAVWCAGVAGAWTMGAWAQGSGPVAGGAAPASRMAVIASGDCHDPDLISNLRLLSTELSSRLHGGFVDEAAFRARLAPRATQTLDELARQTDAAQMLYYQALYPKAEEQTREVLGELERLPPGPERVALAVRANVLYGVIQRGLGHPEEGDGSFRKVIRLAPRHQLDPDLFSPSTRARFEKARKDVLAQKRVRLEVSSTPAGADVFLDGLAVGRTPLVASVVPGATQLLLAREGAWSLPHALELERETTLHVDLQFEGAIHPERVPCINTRGDERSRLAMASRLATLVEVDEVVVLRLERQSAGPSWLAATVTSVGSGKIREGGLKVRDPALPPEGLAELANFIVTGKVGSKVVALGPGTPALAQRGPAPAPVGVRGEQAVAAQAPRDEGWPSAASPIGLERTGAAPPSASGRTDRTPLGLGIGGAGVIAAGAAVFFELQASSAWSRFNAVYRDGGAPSADSAGFTEVVQAKHQAQTAEAVALVSGILGVVGLSSGIALLVIDAHPGTAPISARVLAGPGALGLSGTF